MDFEAELTRLAEPIEVEPPCGQSLDATQTLAALDALQVFGRLTPPESEPDWRGLRSTCLTVLGSTKDLRVLAHLTAAVIRVDSLSSALRMFPLVSMWLERYWDEVHPRLEEDAIMRRNALAFFADRVAIVEAIRRVPIVTDPRLGSYSLRDFDVASGTRAQSDRQATPVSAERIHSALAAADPESLAGIFELALAAGSALERVEEIMLGRGGGSGAMPKLDSIVQVLQRIRQMLSPHVPQRSDDADTGPALAVGIVENSEEKAASTEVGSVRSRQDVLRAFDAVLGYYRNMEPASPVPVIVERAKRLVPMSFLEVIAEMAPEALEPAKKAAGLRGPA